MFIIIKFYQTLIKIFKNKVRKNDLNKIYIKNIIKQIKKKKNNYIKIYLIYTLRLCFVIKSCLF